MGFVPDDFEVPVTLTGDGFRLEPLGPEHNERDHEAWMSSIEHIHATPGFPDGTWPSPMSLESNLADLDRHAADFRNRSGFTFSIVDGDEIDGEPEVIGCLYIYPSTTADAAVSSWVRASRAEMDVVVWRAITSWLRTDWPFTSVAYAER